MLDEHPRPHDQDSRRLIAPLVGRILHRDLDGALFDDAPNRFTFRFADPSRLRAQLAEDFTDEIYMAPWVELVPVAAVSVPEREDREVAWVFLDWRDPGPPRIVIATPDNWSAGPEHTAAGLASLGL